MYQQVSIKSQLVQICTQQPVNVSWNVSLGYVFSWLYQHNLCPLPKVLMVVLMGVCTNAVSSHNISTKYHSKPAPWSASDCLGDTQVLVHCTVNPVAPSKPGDDINLDDTT